MGRIYTISEKVQRKTKGRVSSIFLILNILFWCLLALAVSAGVCYGIFGTLRGHGVFLFCATGYTGLGIGLLGGYLYLDRYQG